MSLPQKQSTAWPFEGTPTRLYPQTSIAYSSSAFTCIAAAGVVLEVLSPDQVIKADGAGGCRVAAVTHGVLLLMLQLLQQLLAAARLTSAVGPCPAAELCRADIQQVGVEDGVKWQP